MHGTMKKSPGPTGPPRLTRPSRKMTARSYSWTILMQKQRENGNVKTMRMVEKMKIRVEIQLPKREVSSLLISAASTTSALCPVPFMTNLVSLLVSAVSRMESSVETSILIQEQIIIQMTCFLALGPMKMGGQL